MHMIHLVNLKLQIGFLDVLAKGYVPFSPVSELMLSMALQKMLSYIFILHM